jgi:hypothetical protein
MDIPTQPQVRQGLTQLVRNETLRHNMNRLDPLEVLHTHSELVRFTQRDLQRQDHVTFHP